MKMNHPVYKFLLAIGLLLPASLLAAPAAEARERVNVGACVSWPAYSYFEVVRQKNLAPDYDIRLSVFEDPLGGHAALAAGQIDIYVCTGDYTPLTVARGTDVTNVAFTNPSYGVDHILLAPDVEIDELPGKRISAPEAYIGQLLMGLWLDDEGLSVDDVTWVNLNADEAVGPMMSGDLAAAYMYEPWVTQVLENLPGSRLVGNTAEPRFLDTGIFMDVMYMNTNFIENRRQAALDMLRAQWEAVGYWHENTDEVNELFAEFLGWSVEEIESVVGTNGKYLEGGVYTLDFDESARICGVLEGDAPFGIANGAMPDVVELTNEWWIRLGLMNEMHDAREGIDCSLMADLVEAGFRQSLDAR